MKRMASVAVVLGLIAFTAGCRSNAELNAIVAKARTMMTAPDYIIEEGDDISIRVLDHEQYSIDQQLVRPDGKVSFPRHGDIDVAGKTVEKLRAELETSFQSSLNLAKKPRVYVSVNQFLSKAVTIFGEINRPGRYAYTGQMRVADLLGRAIGIRDVTAAHNETLLFRDVGGTTKIYKIRLKDFGYEGDFTTNYFLRPGDIVYVPRNGWAKAAMAVQRVLLPIEAVFNAIGLGARTTNLFLGAPN